MLNGHYRSLILLAALLLSLPPVGSQSSTGQLSPSPNATPSAATTQASASASALTAPRKLLAQGKYDDALAALHELEGKYPGLAGLSHEFGVTYYKKADYPNAIAYLKKAREENPEDGEAIQLLGIAFYLAGRPADAIAPLEK